MAEGWAKQILAKDWDVYSAGIETHGVNPKAIEAMKEVGIDISNHTSDLIDNNIIKNSNLVVTLCSDADVNCPTLQQQMLRRNIGDLMILQANHGQSSNVRDEIKVAIENFKSR